MLNIAVFVIFLSTAEKERKCKELKHACDACGYHKNLRRAKALFNTNYKK